MQLGIVEVTGARGASRPTRLLRRNSANAVRLDVIRFKPNFNDLAVLALA